MQQFLPLALQAGAGLLLALISYQDWQARSISWPAFPALGLVLLLARLWYEPAALVAGQVAVNWGVLLALVAVLALYTHWRLRLGLWSCLGTGDVLFWAVVAVYFSPAGFLLFLVISSIVALATALLVRLRTTTAIEAFRIPLAGVQASCLLLLLGVQAMAPAGVLKWVALNQLTELLP